MIAGELTVLSAIVRMADAGGLVRDAYRALRTSEGEQVSWVG
jgi:hypothetical protein